jgi:hypothetical protein
MYTYDTEVNIEDGGNRFLRKISTNLLDTPIYFYMEVGMKIMN